LNRLRGGLRTTFVALEVRNFRLYFVGQLVSTVGNWMQMIGQAWLVLELTDSGAMLGLVTAMQWIPTLVISGWAGLLADRSSKRTIVIGAEIAAGLLALTLGLLVLTDVVQFWMVLVIALLFGVTTAISQPARQAFVHELVGPERLTNGVSLTNLIINLGRLVGPALAGLVISVWDLSVCFLANSLSYIAPIVTLAALSTRDLHTVAPVKRAKGQLVEGIRYVRRTPRLWVPLVLMVAIGTFTYEYQVLLPLLTSDTFGMDAAGYGLLQTVMSVGGITGGIWVARRSVPTNRLIVGAAVALGAVTLALALVPGFGGALLVVPFLGATSIAFSTLVNSSLQLTAEPEMRSRVVGLFMIAWIGTTPIGGPLVGWIAQTWSPRWALLLGGVVAIVAGALAWRRLRHEPDPSTHEPSRHELREPRRTERLEDPADEVGEVQPRLA
jgi:MFS family permease